MFILTCDASVPSNGCCCGEGSRQVETQYSVTSARIIDEAESLTQQRLTDHHVTAPIRPIFRTRPEKKTLSQTVRLRSLPLQNPPRTVCSTLWLLSFSALRLPSLPLPSWRVFLKTFLCRIILGNGTFQRFYEWTKSLSIILIFKGCSAFLPDVCANTRFV